MVDGRDLTIWLVAGLLAGILGGCTPQNVRGTSGLVAGPSIDQSHPRATLVLGSEDLIGDISLNSPRFRSLGELSQAQVTVQNLTDSRYTLEYKFDWEDDQGFAVAGTTGTWHRFTLAPRQVETFTSTGKVPEATFIVFSVRLPDDVFIHADQKPKSQQSGGFEN